MTTAPIFGWYTNPGFLAAALLSTPRCTNFDSNHNVRHPGTLSCNDCDQQCHHDNYCFDKQWCSGVDSCTEVSGSCAAAWTWSATPVTKVVGGTTVFGTPLQICRAPYQGGVLVGSTTTGSSTCLVSVGGASQALTNFTYMDSSSSYSWSNKTQDTWNTWWSLLVPAGYVPYAGGIEPVVEVAYVCRIPREGVSMQVGYAVKGCAGWVCSAGAGYIAGSGAFFFMQLQSAVNHL